MKLKLLLSALFLLTVLAAFTVNKTTSAAGACETCDNLTGLEKVVCLAEDFKASLTATQLATVQLDYTFANAKKWSNLPVTLAPRIGIRFGDLNTDQLAKAKAIVQAILGATPNEGYDEAQQLWAADQYLSQNGGGSTYGSGQYYMAFLGTPSTSGAWELQTGGHHLAIANTYGNGALTGATPSFRAVEPFAAFQSGSNTYQPIVQERDSLAAVLASLTTAQLASAKLGTTYSDITLGPNKDWQFPTAKSGLKCSELTASQKSLVLAAIRTYVKDLDDSTATYYMNLYTAQLDDTYIAYANTPALSAQKDYIRIDGPRVWIEYSVQNGIILSPTHPHSVWRDHVSDYGGLGNPAVGTNTIVGYEGKFDIFPNPASTTALVQLDLKAAATIGLDLFDLAGKKVIGPLQFNMTTGSHTLPLNLQNLPNGIYTCKLTIQDNDGQTYVAGKKLVKS